MCLTELHYGSIGISRVGLEPQLYQNCMLPLHYTPKDELEFESRSKVSKTLMLSKLHHTSNRPYRIRTDVKSFRNFRYCPNYTNGLCELRDSNPYPQLGRLGCYHCSPNSPRRKQESNLSAFYSSPLSKRDQYHSDITASLHEGFELSPRDSHSPMLPLHQRRMEMTGIEPAMTTL